jgi:hypothetical protein
MNELSNGTVLRPADFDLTNDWSWDWYSRRLSVNGSLDLAFPNYNIVIKNSYGANDGTWGQIIETAGGLTWWFTGNARLSPWTMVMVEIKEHPYSCTVYRYNLLIPGWWNPTNWVCGPQNNTCNAGWAAWYNPWSCWWQATWTCVGTNWWSSDSCSKANDACNIWTSECNDTIDNDGDGNIDFPQDPGCTDANDDSEAVVTSLNIDLTRGWGGTVVFKNINTNVIYNVTAVDTAWSLNVPYGEYELSSYSNVCPSPLIPQSNTPIWEIKNLGKPWLAQSFDVSINCS